MTAILKPSNEALTDEVLRQLGDDGLSRILVVSDGQVEEIIFTTPHMVANFANMATS